MMARKPARVAGAPRRRGGVLGGTRCSVAQAVLGRRDSSGRRTQVEERIELQLRGLRTPADPLPERSHEDESIEPWELVSV